MQRGVRIAAHAGNQQVCEVGSYVTSAARHRADGTEQLGFLGALSYEAAGSAAQYVEAVLRFGKGDRMSTPTDS